MRGRVRRLFFSAAQQASTGPASCLARALLLLPADERSPVSVPPLLTLEGSHIWAGRPLSCSWPARRRTLAAPAAGPSRPPPCPGPSSGARAARSPPQTPLARLPRRTARDGNEGTPSVRLNLPRVKGVAEAEGPRAIAGVHLNRRLGRSPVTRSPGSSDAGARLASSSSRQLRSEPVEPSCSTSTWPAWSGCIAPPPPRCVARLPLRLSSQGLRGRLCTARTADPSLRARSRARSCGAPRPRRAQAGRSDGIGRPASRPPGWLLPSGVAVGQGAYK